MNIIIAIIVLGVLIFVHELGHFLVAKFCNVYVEKFSIGFGPRLYSKKYGETEYALSAIPLGGYVKMYGEQGGDEPGSETYDPMKEGRSFSDKSAWQKAAIVLAGPLFNVIFAVLIFCGLYMSGLPSYSPILDGIEENSVAYSAGLRNGDKVEAINGKNISSWRELSTFIMENPGKSATLKLSDGKEITLTIGQKEVSDVFGDKEIVGDIGASLLVKPIIGELIPDMPAAKAGLQIGDEIVSINGTPISTWNQSADYIRKSPEKELAIIIKRNGKEETITLTPKKSEIGKDENKQEVGLIGISPYSGDVKVSYGVIESISLGIEQSVDMTKMIYVGFAKLIKQEVPSDSLGGPILIMQTAAQSAEAGAAALLFFVAAISINLAVFNLLPIPVLDGGQLVIITAEGVMGRKLGEKVLGAFQMFGLCVILGLMVFAFYNDIMRFFK